MILGMNTLLVEIRNAKVVDVLISDDTLSVDLEDGRSLCKAYLSRVETESIQTNAVT